MADKKSVRHRRPADGADPPNPKVTWDDSALRSCYANVCNVSSTREEVVLLFGVNQTWQGADSEVKVQLTDRVILSPFAAKRLSLLLHDILSQYEQRFGGLEAVPEGRASGATS